jgi:hypothetical protein
VPISQKDLIMRKAISLFILSICLFSLAGCQETAIKQNPDEMLVNGKTPNVMVGVWETEVGGTVWAFKIEPDGSILKLIHPIAGQINVKEGGRDVEGPDPGTYAAFIMGPCESNFDAATGIFTVHIVLDNFIMKLPQGELVGKSDDYFKGKVSKDGKTWKANWFAYSSLEGGSLPDVNEINANPEGLVFKKLDLNRLADPNKSSEHKH